MLMLTECQYLWQYSKLVKFTSYIVSVVDLGCNFIMIPKGIASGLCNHYTTRSANIHVVNKRTGTY